jgi:S1-C subfamily serine protease
MTSPPHPDDLGDDTRFVPSSGRAHPAAPGRTAPGGPPPAPESAPAGSVPAPEPRRGRLASTLLAGAVAGALVAAPTTLLLDRQQQPPAPVRAAAEANPVSAPAGSGLDVASVLDIARAGVVAIRTEVVSQTSNGLQRGEAAGSGFVLDADGTIVTNSHVVDGARTISVELVDGTELDAELVAHDPSTDLAVLSVDGGGALTALELASSTDLGVGDPVVAIGNALGLDGDLTVTTGIVSAKDRDVAVPNGVTLRGMIQTDAAINPGNSGGPLVDAAGRVVGINSAGALGAQSIGFAIPIDEAMPVIEALAAGEVPAQPFLGVQTVELDDHLRAQAGTHREAGALVMGVTEGSGAENAGIRIGDVIIGIDGDAVDGSADLGDAVSGLEPGDAIEVRLDRGGDERTVTLTVGARPGSVA